MTSSQISLQVVVPDFGFAASIGPQAGSRASENRYGKGREILAKVASIWPSLRRHGRSIWPGDRGAAVR